MNFIDNKGHFIITLFHISVCNSCNHFSVFVYLCKFSYKSCISIVGVNTNANLSITYSRPWHVVGVC